MRATCPTHLILLDCITNILLGPNILLSVLFSNTRSAGLSSYFREVDQVNPLKTSGNYMYRLL
jgi:hypothetical protein